MGGVTWEACCLAVRVGACSSCAKDPFAGSLALYCVDFLAVSFVCETQ